jgi:MFS family permease
MSKSYSLGAHTRVLLYGSTIWYFGEGMLGPIFGVFTQRVGGSILDISWLWAAYLIASGVCTIFVGKLSDARISKEKLLIAGYTLNTLFTFAYLVASTPQRLLIVQLGLGLASALATPTWDALYTRHHDKAHSGFVWGLAGGQAELVTGLAVIAGGLLATYFSFTLLFLTMGIVQALATIYQAQILWLGGESGARPASFYASDTSPAVAVAGRRYTVVYHQPPGTPEIASHAITVRFKDHTGRVVDVLYTQHDAGSPFPAEARSPVERPGLLIGDRSLAARSA